MSQEEDREDHEGEEEDGGIGRQQHWELLLARLLRLHPVPVSPSCRSPPGLVLPAKVLRGLQWVRPHATAEIL